MSMKRLAAAVLAVCMMGSSAAAQALTEPAASEYTEPASTEQTEVPAESGIAAEETVEEPDWRLLLVNPWNQLPADYKIELKRMTNGLYVDARIYDDLSAMLGACWDAGLHPVVCSAYRSHATQQRLHNNKIYRLMASGYSWNAAVQEAGRWVAVPGTSEHETGMALDIVSYSYQNLTYKQAETAEQKWFMEHGWEYGFILRYPEDKCDVTGIGYEPWHYRYVGREAAQTMRESGLCLEEYLKVLAGEMELPVPPAETMQPAEGLTSVEPFVSEPSAES